MRFTISSFAAAALAAGLAACAQTDPADGGDSGLAESDVVALAPFQNQRLEEIRAAALAKGVTNPVLIAGVAFLEGNLAQCFSEAPHHCPGPHSDYCGGPVLAGSADGPCGARAGGLGMFQFDAGNYDETLAANGAGILSAPGNIAAGVDFIINKTYVCPNTPDFGNDPVVGRERARDFINRARVGTPDYGTFLTAMAWCYNGCAPGGCNTGAQAALYDGATREMLAAKGEAFWSGRSARPGEYESGASNASIATTHQALGGRPGDADLAQAGGFVHPWPDHTGCEVQNFTGTKRPDGSVDTGAAGVLMFNPRQGRSWWVRGQVFKQYVGMNTVGLGCAVGDEEAFAGAGGVTGFRQRFEHGTVVWDHAVR